MIKSISIASRDQIKPVKILNKPFCLIEESITISPLDNRSSLLEFKYISQVDIILSIFVNTREIENLVTGQTRFLNTPEKGYQVHLDLPIGNNKLIKIKLPFSEQEFFHNDQTFQKEYEYQKLIFRIESEEDDQRIVDYSYFTALQEQELNGLKLIRNKIEVNKDVYLIFDIYGIQNQIALQSDTSTTQQKCNVCISEPVDTIILPCRHMCLCKSCSKQYNHQNENNFYQIKRECPVCRKRITSFLSLNSLE